MKILFVDNDPRVLKRASTKLTDIGHVVITAFNASDVLDILYETQGIDLVITDNNMPGGMNGHELANAIRKIGHKMPIWLYTASANVDGEFAKACGINHIFSKHRPDELWSAVKNFGK